MLTDRRDGVHWSVDSWYRPNGHLPFVMPVESWQARRTGWEPPFDRLNPYPASSDALCQEPDVDSAGLLAPDAGHGS